MPHPLEQGLRLSALGATSVFTCQSAPSIRTRIKTYFFGIDATWLLVRVPHPLEQGLRPIVSSGGLVMPAVRVPHPLEQGLRHCFINWLIFFHSQSAPSIRTRIKTLRFSFHIIKNFNVRVPHPLEQGLRLQNQL